MKGICLSLLLFYALAPDPLLGQGNTFPSSGNVGIGTTTPSHRLEVLFSGTRTFALYGVHGPRLYRTGDGGGWAMSYGFLSEDKSSDWEGFGGYGGTSAFHYWFIGKSITNAAMYIRKEGNVGIGVVDPTHKLEVNGTIRAKEIKLEATAWPDYVFEDGYELMSLEEVKTHIDQNGHLPGLKPAKEYETEGVNMMELNQKMLEKIKELTLHIIRLELQFKDFIEQDEFQKINYLNQ